MAYLAVDPFWDDVPFDLRHADLLRRIGLRSPSDPGLVKGYPRQTWYTPTRSRRLSVSTTDPRARTSGHNWH
jgi:hypothetical protein